MSKAWSHLPNAHHIDWVLASLKETPELWNAARDAAWNAARAAAWNAARDAAWDAALDATRVAAWNAARAAALEPAWNAAGAAANAAVWNKNRHMSLNEMLYESRLISNSARYAARHVMAALIAYDDCDQFLIMPYEKLKVWAVLSEDPRAVLLLPMVYVKEELANMNLQPA